MESKVRSNGFVPFWFWNGKQDEVEIRRQVRLAVEAGLNGLAVHAREGNRTPYLSDKWFELVDAACDEAEKYGLKIWIYDEEGYPSGTAGYRIQKMNPAYRQQYLSFGYFSSGEISRMHNIEAVFDAATNRLIPSPQDGKTDGNFLVFQRKFVDRYVDTMNPEVTNHFIRLTHEKYKEKLGRYFGSTITFFYTDDVNFHMEGDKGLPWTENLDFKFHLKHGYRLMDNLPALIEDLPGSDRIRKDYYGFLLDLFLANFAEPIYRWCQQNGVKFTGHLRGDEGPVDRAIFQFASAMPFFEYEDVPGIDDFLLRLDDFRYLRRLSNNRGLYPIPTYKFVSSVANQLKGGICGAEVMASCGWGYSLAEQNAQLSYEASMGINLFTPHDFTYATAGVAKRDHPPSFFFQQPYWPLWKDLHAKFARISKFLTRGKYFADILVLYPESQSWAMMDGESINPSFKCMKGRSRSLEDLSSFERDFAGICFNLVKGHVGFDVGSERIIERHGVVKSGKLHIGDMSYKHIIILNNSIFSSKMDKIIADFAKAGGNIVKSGTGSSGLPKDIDLEGNIEDLSVHTRLCKGKKEFFLCNHSPDYVDIRIPSQYSSCEAYDPASDRIIISGVPTEISIPPFGSVYMLPAGRIRSKKIKSEKSLFSGVPSGRTIPLKGWHIRRDNENIMLVDKCLVDGSEIFLNELHQLKPSPSKFSIRFKIFGRVDIDRLLGENLKDMDISVNGNRVPVDRKYTFPGTGCLDSVKLGRFLEKGENVIEICGFEPGKRVENFYLTGNFSADACKNGVFASSAKFAEEGTLKLGDLSKQGMPFYWGSTTYTTILPENCGGFSWLDLGNVDGAVEIFLDGVKIGSILYPPYRIYVGDQKLKKDSRLELRLYNTAQNFFGPHRWENLNTALIHIEHESPGKSKNFNVKPFGIYGPVRLIE